jgi:glycosyltransferase involved in cell wall biosynthesis
MAMTVGSGLGSRPGAIPSERSRRRVLMLAYYFPPLGGGGVQRTLKHVKYLPAVGWDPIVLTTRPAYAPTLDPMLADEVPAGTPVIRAPELVPLHLVKWAVAGALRRARLPTTPAQYIGWPDEKAGWMPAAIWHAVGAVRRHRPDVLYSTSAPVSAHVVALTVSRITGIPWVADFRDPWTKNAPWDPASSALAGLSARLERQVVRSAASVVVADERIELLGVAPQGPRRNVIRNGVDPEDVPPPEPWSRSERFRISYVGALYGRRDAAPVFAALRALVDRGAIDAATLELRIVGDIALGGDTNLEQLPRSITGYVDHRAAVSEMAAADVLLLYAPADHRWPAAKIYEYLATGRKVLCVAGPENFAFRLVRELDAGPCVEPSDQPAIERAIEHLYECWKAGDLTVAPEVRAETLRRFSRPALARELATVLDAAADRVG